MDGGLDRSAPALPGLEHVAVEAAPERRCDPRAQQRYGVRVAAPRVPQNTRMAHAKSRDSQHHKKRSERTRRHVCVVRISRAQVCTFLLMNPTPVNRQKLLLEITGLTALVRWGLVYFNYTGS